MSFEIRRNGFIAKRIIFGPLPGKDKRDLRIEDGGFYPERHNGEEPGWRAASFTQEIYRLDPLDPSRQTIIANFREMRDLFTLYHSSEVINDEEFSLLYEAFSSKN